MANADLDYAYGEGVAPPLPEFRSWQWRVGNAIVTVLARAGIGPSDLLTTRGRKTGPTPYHSRCSVMSDGGKSLVAAYGPVSWVHNARAEGAVELRSGRVSRRYAIREAPAREVGAVLTRHVGIATATRASFRARKGSPIEDFVAEADRYPVLELTSLETAGPAGSAMSTGV